MNRTKRATRSRGSAPRWISVLAGAVLASPGLCAQEYSAGYETLRITDEARGRPIHLDIWYPSVDGQEQAHNYGFSVGRVASGAEFAGDERPVVLLSHGAMGAASNYSWIAEHLARRGFVVLGVSHFRESRVFGPETVEPEAVGRFHDRKLDLVTALEFLLERSSYAPNLDAGRLAAIGHSSGGASVLMLAGVEFSPALLAAHCASSAAAIDKGCWYPTADAGQAPNRKPVATARRLRALVVMDPAVGPGFTESALQAVSLPTLVIASVQNDFLPYAFHAGRVAKWIPTAEVVLFDGGEGHFVYLDACSVPVEVMGVPLCSDRPGVDRTAVHRKLAITIERFLARHLEGGGS